jgi:alkylhydroperoxidase family enzyme
MWRGPLTPRKRAKACRNGASAAIISAMAHITYVPEDQAEGLLAQLYRRLRGEEGVVDNILRIHSLNPSSMDDHVRMYAHLMRGPSPLSRIQREMIAVTVSAENDCFY